MVVDILDTERRCNRHAVSIGIDSAEEAAADFIFGVTTGHQYRQPVEALLDPGIKYAARQQLEILFVNVDGTFFERIGLLFEDHLVIDFFRIAEARRTFRIE